MEGIVELEGLDGEKRNLRRVLYTGHYIQLVLTTLAPGEETGEEAHEDRDRFLRVEAGQGELVVDGAKRDIAADFTMVVPAGARHRVRNIGREPLKVYTLYSPPDRDDDEAPPTKRDPKRKQEPVDAPTGE